MTPDQSAAARDHARMTERFLQSIFNGHDAGTVTLFSKPSNRSIFVQLQSKNWSGEAAKRAMLAREKENVYFAIGVLGQHPYKGRGKQDGVMSLPGLRADIEALGPKPSGDNLPRIVEDIWKGRVKSSSFPAPRYSGLSSRTPARDPRSTPPGEN
jgi:hypothetical protein